MEYEIQLSKEFRFLIKKSDTEVSLFFGLHISSVLSSDLK